LRTQWGNKSFIAAASAFFPPLTPHALAAAAAANFLIRVAVPQTWRGQKQTTSPGSAALETQNARASIRPGATFDLNSFFS
jgi:hypothetical protein